MNLRLIAGIMLPTTLSARANLPISLFQMINYSATYLPESLTEESALAVRGRGSGGCNESQSEQVRDLNLVTQAVTRWKHRAMSSQRSRVKRLEG